MPQLREYTNTKVPEGNPYEQTAYSVERYGRIAQENIEKGAGALSQVAGAVASHEQRLDLSNQATTAANQNADIAKQFADWQQTHNNDYDAADPDKAYRDFLTNTVDKQNEALISGANTQAGRDWAIQHGADRKAAWAKTIYSEQIADETARIQDGFHHIINVNSAIAAQHPEQAQDLINQASTYIQAMMPSNVHKDSIDQATQFIASGAGEGLVAAATKGVYSDLTGAAQLNADGAEDPHFQSVNVAEAAKARVDAVRKQLTPLLEQMGPQKSSALTARLDALESDLPRQAEIVDRTVTAAAIKQRQVLSEKKSGDYQQQAFAPGANMAQIIQHLNTDPDVRPSDARAVTNYLDGIVGRAQREEKVTSVEQTRADKAQRASEYNSLFQMASTGAPSRADILNLAAAHNLSPTETNVLLHARDYANSQKVTPFAKETVDGFGKEAEDIFGLTGQQQPDPVARQTFNNFMGWLHQSVLNQSDPEGWLADNSKRIRDVMSSMNKSLTAGQSGIGKYQAIINNNLPGVKPKAAAPQLPPAPAGVDAKTWGAMTPQERALWQK